MISGLPVTEFSGPPDTWTPDPDIDRRDGEALHQLLYVNGDSDLPRAWAARATECLVSSACTELARIAEAKPSGSRLRVLDYGTGTGVAVIEFLKSLRALGLLHELLERGIRLELYLADIPSSWFAYGWDLLHGCDLVSFHSLVDESGRFRALKSVLMDSNMDLILASMVFHLIPPSGLVSLSRSAAAILEPGNKILWNSPDLGPARGDSLLFHDGNRMLRDHWRRLMLGVSEPLSGIQARALSHAMGRCTDGGPLVDEGRAGKRILPNPNSVRIIDESFSPVFDCATWTRRYWMTFEEVVETLLVPSNQTEYLPEIDDASLRSELIADLMHGLVFPVISERLGGSDGGYHIQWTFGHYVRR